MRELDAPVGSEAWMQVREKVFRYLEQRNEARLCLLELERFRYSSVLSLDDRELLHRDIRMLHDSYANGAIHQADLLARFIGYDVGNGPMVFTSPL